MTNYIRSDKVDSYLMVSADKLILIHPISRNNKCFGEVDTIIRLLQDFFRSNKAVFYNIDDLTNLEMTCTMCEAELKNTNNNNPTIQNRNTKIKIKDLLNRVPRESYIQVNDVITMRRNLNIRNREYIQKNACECVSCVNPKGLNGLAYPILLSSYISIHDNNDIGNIYECRTCKTSFCKNCKYKYDNKNNFVNCNLDKLNIIHNHLSCDDLNNIKERDPSEILIKMTTQKCPECKVSIEKNDGCNHMTCRSCRHEFCFLCLKKWYCGVH